MKKIIGAALILGVVACGGGPEAGQVSSTVADAQVKGQVQPSVFKMYSTNMPKPAPYCDLHATLSLNSAQARVSESLTGVCEIYVAPSVRVYDMVASDAECGSKRYVSRSVQRYGKHGGIGRPVALEIIDHRFRHCKDVVPARIVMTETYADGSTEQTYSDDSIPYGGIL